VKFDEVVEVVGDRPGKDAAYLLDSTKARTTLGWTDVVSLDQGIDETITWISSNLEELKKQPFDYLHKP
jgi:dTDP-glucose 4,6-dehydratase